MGKHNVTTVIIHDKVIFTHGVDKNIVAVEHDSLKYSNFREELLWIVIYTPKLGFSL